MLLGKKISFGMFTINNTNYLTIAENRYCYFRKSLFIINDVPGVFCSIMNNFWNPRLGNVTTNTLSDRNFKWLYNLVIAWIFWTVSCFLDQYVFLAIDKIDHAISKVQSRNTVFNQIPSYLLFRFYVIDRS